MTLKLEGGTVQPDFITSDETWASFEMPEIYPGKKFRYANEDYGLVDVASGNVITTTVEYPVTEQNLLAIVKLYINHLYLKCVFPDNVFSFIESEEAKEAESIQVDWLNNNPVAVQIGGLCQLNHDNFPPL